MAQPPYLMIVDSIRDRIASGELVAGARVPSTRQIVQEWNVAMATASKALATLQQEGLVWVLPGVGTVVGHTGRRGPELDRSTIIRAAVRIADLEGFDALSMRRVAAELGAGAMSLYRHVPGKEELELLMRDAVFGERPLPSTPPAGWRARLELSSGSLWALYRRHPWLARTTSVTRPYVGSNQLPYSEWNLSALSGIGLDDDTVFWLHLSLFGFVHGSAASLDAEDREEATTGLTPQQWLSTRESATRSLMGSGAFPHSARIFLGQRINLDLDALFDFGLARFLDGVAVLVAGSQP